MKKVYLAALLALPLLAAPASAGGFSLPCNIRIGGYIHCGEGFNGPRLGPWYNYWPYEAHFVTPAPTGYPYWPPPQSQLPAPPTSGVPYPAPAPGADVKAVGYYSYPYYPYQQSIYYGPAPSYWYAPRP